MKTNISHCFYCKRTKEQVPLIKLEYANSEFHICPQHMPILIHNPGELTGMLPGAKNLDPADHKD